MKKLKLREKVSGRKKLKLKTKKLILKVNTIRKKLLVEIPTLRKKLKVTSIFKHKDEIIKVLSQCKSYTSSTEPLDLDDKTNHPLSEKFLQGYIDLITFGDPRIQNLNFNKSGVLFTNKSHYFVDRSFYTLFSTEPLIYNRESKRKK